MSIHKAPRRVSASYDLKSPPPCGEAEIASVKRDQFRVGEHVKTYLDKAPASFWQERYRNPLLNR
jgi:hypothetical protein